MSAGASGSAAVEEPGVAVLRAPGDLHTPVSAYLALRAAWPGPAFLLESVEGGRARGRYSAVGLAPDAAWRLRDGAAEVGRSGAGGALAFAPQGLAPVAGLRAFLAEGRLPAAALAGLPPLAAGAFGYVGYDAVRAMERLAPAKPDPIGVPDALLLRPSLVAVFDALEGEVVVVAPHRAGGRGVAEALARRAVAALAAPASPPPAPPRASGAAVASNTPAADYLAMAARAREYILAGDVFQAVLSQRFTRPLGGEPFALYRALRRVNPAPFLSFLDMRGLGDDGADFAVCCSSPEILVRLREGTVTVRPIAGTRPRGATPAQDEALAAELLADPKERAEHLMLLDLGRNDAGRVAARGTVRVTTAFEVERYRRVQHLVSNVEATLAPGLDAVDALVAGFPAGTVTGAPKVRAMEIIDELERDKRGPYGGLIGYFGADGDMDSCIVLRTAVVKDGVMHVQAGAGIVHDSDPAAEAAECWHKASALFRAADEAERGATSPAG